MITYHGEGCCQGYNMYSGKRMSQYHFVYQKSYTDYLENYCHYPHN